MIQLENEALLLSLVGKTIASIEADDDCNFVVISLTDRTQITLDHARDCCEEFELNDWETDFSLDYPRSAVIQNVSWARTEQGGYDDALEINIETSQGRFWMEWTYEEGCSDTDEAQTLNIAIQNI